jgi:hypothetical protein
VEFLLRKEALSKAEVYPWRLRFSQGKDLGSIRAIALSDKMYMLKTTSPIKSG